MAQDYDFLIAGAGASGLAMAYFLPPKARVLLVDKAPKSSNDRTWCFWEAQPNPFDHLVFKRWDEIYFHAADFSSRLQIAPYQYKMIRGIDYYTFLQQELAQRPNTQFIYGDIDLLESDQTEARVSVGGQIFRAPWGFNSAIRPEVVSGYHHLLQHFKGYLIRTPEDFFDPTSATMMDFRIPQNNETQFVYVLPFDARTALVEYTLFSSSLLSKEAYDLGLQNYIKEFLYLEQYEILEVEEGVIPMTDAPFPVWHSPRIANIGIAGGRAKASTGYAFKRILAQTQAIARSLEQSGQPSLPTQFFDRHAWMDSVYLRVLEQKRMGGAPFFSGLFQRNPAPMVLKFLDEATSPFEDLKLMTTVNIPVFTKSAFEISFQSARRSLMRIPPITTR